MAKRKQQGLSWQLIGMVAVLAAFFVMGLIWLVSGGSDEGAQSPVVLSLGGDVAAEQQGVTEDGRAFMGDEDAPVVVYEFADFQCPHCRDFSQTYSKGFKRDYVGTGKVKMIWVNFAFMGDESNSAAAAGYCAADQGQFWAMHDWIFENQSAVNNNGAFSAQRLTEMAESAGMDTEVFEACLADPATIDRVQADTDFARETGVESTPSFLVENSETLVAGGGQAEVEELVAAVEEALAAQE
jgi:protein-disulfide isomerase